MINLCTRGPDRQLRRWPIVLGIVIAAGCARQADGAGGITGITVVDVGCPTVITATTCPTRPLPARLRVIRPNSTNVVAELQTHNDGTFTMMLPPGRYEIESSNLSGTPFPTAHPLSVEVIDGQLKSITIEFDSGVR
jgi:hypothetical protein